MTNKPGFNSLIRILSCVLALRFHYANISPSVMDIGLKLAYWQGKHFLRNLNSQAQRWYRFWEIPQGYPASKLPLFILRMAILIGIYMILDQLLMHLSRLPVSSYEDGFIFQGFLKRLFSTKYNALLVPIVILLLVCGKRLIISWENLVQGRSLRFLVMLAATVLAWIFATYNYNLYFNHGHIADRLLLPVLVMLIYWRPIFVFPFLSVLLSIIWQFDVLPGFSWAPQFPLIRMILVFSAFFLFFVITKSAHITDFVILAGSLMAAHYWVPGIGKLNQWWLLHDQLNLLLPATFANGWLGFLDYDTISRLTQILEPFNLPLKILTIVIECGMIFLFMNRKLSLVLLGGCILMHLGIFAVTGIFFWMWIIMDIGLLIFLLRQDPFPFFQKPQLIASIILIAGSPFWFQPVKLSWLDVPLSYTYRIQASTGDGDLHNLPPRFFAPYDYQFTLGVFKYLSMEPSLPVTWGTTNDKTVATWLQSPRTKKQILSYEQAHGRVYYDEKKISQFDNFIKQTVIHWNARPTKRSWYENLQPPALLWTFPRSPKIDCSTPITRVVVVQVTSYFHQGKYSEIRELPVYEMLIP